MNDNNTNQSDRRIELGDVTIHEPALGDNEGVMVKLQIPFRFYLSGRRSLSEYKRISMEDIRMKASTIFDLVKHLNYSIIEGESNDLAKHAEFIDVLSILGGGLMEAQEATENEFNWYVEKQTSALTENKSPDAPQPAPEAPITKVDGRRRPSSIEEDYVYLDFDLSLLETADIPDVAVALSAILHHPLLPKTLYNHIMEGMNDVFNHLTTKQKNMINDDDTSALYIGELLEFYEKNQIKDKVAKNNPLDLSSSSIEDLARKLSDIMHDENLPTRVFNCLNDEFAQINVDTNSPENILWNLQEQLKEETGGAE